MNWFARPRFVSVEHLHAPVAISGGLTPIRIVLDGSGVLEVGLVRRRFRRGLDTVLLVPAAPRVTIRARRPLRVLDLFGAEERTIDVMLLPAAPMPDPLELLPWRRSRARCDLPADLRPPGVRLVRLVHSALWPLASSEDEASGQSAQTSAHDMTRATPAKRGE